MILSMNKKTAISSPDALASIPENVKEAISKFSQRITGEFHDKITQVILFGSYARGDYHSDSDVDLLVLTTDDSWDMKKRIMDIGFGLYPEMGVMVSSKVMTEEHYAMMKNFLFIQEVSRDGIAVA